MSDHPPAPSLEFLARQMQRILAELATMREDNAVAFAILQRLDGTLTAHLGEVRAMQSQHARTRARLTAIEAVLPPSS